jgi:hypothetical protein
LNAKTLEIQNIMSAELVTLKHESTTVLTQVRRELATAKGQRDMLKQLLGADGDGLTAEEEEDEGEEESQDDAALQESLAALKEREIEQRLLEKFSLILKAEQDIDADTLTWQSIRLRRSCRTNGRNFWIRLGGQRQRKFRQCTTSLKKRTSRRVR